MPKFEAHEYLAVEDYRETLGTLHAVSGMLLFEFAKERQNTRDNIICNFIARTDVMSQAVFRLFDMKDYQDCWVIHRCLLDRLFHLWQLNERDEFEVFEAWSFLQQYKAAEKLGNDPQFAAAINSAAFKLTAEQLKRAQTLSKSPPVWRRPRGEAIAKDMDMAFLYSLGFDFASAHVHPMANDGQQDFYTITGLQPAPEFPDHRVILSNTLLVATMLVQQGLNSSTLSWRSVVFDFLDELRTSLQKGGRRHGETFLKVGMMAQQGMRLCRPMDGVRKKSTGTPSTA